MARLGLLKHIGLSAPARSCLSAYWNTQVHAWRPCIRRMWPTNISLRRVTFNYTRPLFVPVLAEFLPILLETLYELISQINNQFYLRTRNHFFHYTYNSGKLNRLRVIMQNLIFPFYVVIIKRDWYYWKKPWVVAHQWFLIMQLLCVHALGPCMFALVNMCVGVLFCTGCWS